VADYYQTDRVALASQATFATKLEQKHFNDKQQKARQFFILTGSSKLVAQR